MKAAKAKEHHEHAETAPAKLKPGDAVVIRAKIVEVSHSGEHLVVLTAIGTEAYPEGSRINISAKQVEVVSSEETAT